MQSHEASFLGSTILARQQWTNIAPIVTDHVERILQQLRSMDSAISTMGNRLENHERQTESNFLEVRSALVQLSSRVEAIEKNFPPDLAQHLTNLEERVASVRSELQGQVMRVEERLSVQWQEAQIDRQELRQEMVTQETRILALETMLRGGDVLNELTTHQTCQAEQLALVDSSIQQLQQKSSELCTALQDAENVLREKSLTIQAFERSLTMPARKTGSRLSDLDREVEKWRSAVDKRLQRERDTICTEYSNAIAASLEELRKQDLRKLHRQQLSAEQELVNISKQAEADRNSTTGALRGMQQHMDVQRQQMQEDMLSKLEGLENRLNANIEELDASFKVTANGLSRRITESLAALKRIASSLV